MTETCGACRYYKPTKNKSVGTCEAPMPYHATLDYVNWYVTNNDHVASLCMLYKPKFKDLPKDCVVYD